MTAEHPAIAIARKPPTVLLFAGGFLLHFGIMYPGFMCYDSVNQILEAREGVFSDWHPPVMAIIWRSLDAVIPGPAGMLILQIGLIWFGAYWVFHAFFKPYRDFSAALLLGLLFFLPPIFGISGAILKDVLMWGALLTAFGIAGHIQSAGRQKAWIRLSLCIATLSALWLAVLLRHNALFATIPILSLAYFRLYPRDSFWGLPRAAIPAAITAAILFAASGAINKQLSDRHTQPWIANAAFDIVGIIKRMEDKSAQQTLFAQLRQLLNSTGPIEPVLKAYTPMYWREIFRSKPPVLLLPEKAIGARIHGFETFSDTQLNTLHKLWIQSILTEPFLWIRHRLAVSAYVLGLVPDSTWSPVIMGTEIPLDLEQDYGKFTAPTKLQNQIEAGIILLINAWYFQAWPYLILSIAILLTLLSRRPIAAHAEIICLASSGLLHELGLMLAAPSPDFRYSHYMIYCSLLSLLMLARRTQNKP